MFPRPFWFHSTWWGWYRIGSETVFRVGMLTNGRIIWRCNKYTNYRWTADTSNHLLMQVRKMGLTIKTLIEWAAQKKLPYHFYDLWWSSPVKMWERLKKNHPKKSKKFTKGRNHALASMMAALSGWVAREACFPESGRVPKKNLLLLNKNWTQKMF